MSLRFAPTTQAIIGRDGRVDPHWERWFGELARAVNSSDSQPVPAPEAPPASLVQGYGIAVTGAGTEDSPWVVRLREIADSGSGTLQAITRDSYGRVTGTSTPTTTDLAEGDNLYYTNTRADARVALHADRTDNPHGVTAAQVGADPAGSAAAAQAYAVQRGNHTGSQAASTISDFAATVRSTILTGLSTATNAAIAATDTVLQALGKLQAQVSALASTVSGLVVSTITDGDTTHAPSADAVHDALALKGNVNAQTWTGAHTFSGNVIFRGAQAEMVSESVSLGFGVTSYGAAAPQNIFRTASGTEATPGATNAGSMGGLSWRGHDGSSFSGTRAFVQAAASEAWTAIANGTELRFQTTESGTTSMAVRLTIGNSGHILPGTDNAQNIGSGSRRAKEIFCGNATINTSDAREKTPPRHLTTEEAACALDLASLPCVFQWLHAIEEKGEAARLHVSPTVQDVIACMESHGLDPFRYGFVCYDEWEESIEPAEYEEIDGVQVLVKEAVVHPAGSRYSLRPSEMAHFIQAAVVQRQDAIEARLAALEG